MNVTGSRRPLQRKVFFDYQAETDDIAIACQLVNQNGMAMISLERVFEHSDLKSIEVPNEFVFDFQLLYHVAD